MDQSRSRTQDLQTPTPDHPEPDLVDFGSNADLAAQVPGVDTLTDDDDGLWIEAACPPRPARRPR